MVHEKETIISRTEPGPVKPSRYNHFFPMGDGHVLLFNAFSNSLAAVSLSDFEIIKGIITDPGVSDQDTIEPSKLKDDLIRGGYLIDAELDEFEILKTQNTIGRFAGKTLSLSIALTLSCTNQCVYCFEEKKKDTMNSEVEEALLRFVEKQMVLKKSLQITWFGGEALLLVDSLERLTAAFEKICQKHDAVYLPASIITNGVLLTKEIAMRLKKSHVRFAQVTLDGIQEVHDKRRPMINGQGSFQKIWDNIKQTADILELIVRVNIDRDNEGSMMDFFELWRKEGPYKKVPFYFGHVQASTKACADIAGQCFTTEEYSDLVLMLTQKVNEIGLSNMKYPSLFKIGFCGADNLNSYVISPSGKLFKCWEEVSADEDKTIGNLFEPNPNYRQIMNTTKYLNWNPFEHEVCKFCSVLPVCLGGCIYLGLNSAEKKDCNFWKFKLKEMLILKYTSSNSKTNQ